MILILLCFTVMPARAEDRPLTAFVSIQPQRYFVEKIGGARVVVHVMVRPGASPHTYEPRPEQMKALSRADIYFAVGVSFERAWLGKIAAANTGMQVVRTDDGIIKMDMVDHHHDGEAVTEGAAGHDDQGYPDPHIWLAPLLAGQMARIITDSLIRIDQDHAEDYQANLASLQAEIQRLDADLRSTLEGSQGAPFMVFHPSWGYFARAYGLRQVPIEVEGKEPKPADLAELIRRARAESIRVIFVQPQFSQRSARLIAREIKGQVIEVDPLAQDWNSNLRTVALKFREAVP